MATSSIFAPYVIDNLKDAEAFAEALEKSEALEKQYAHIKPKSNCVAVTDPEEIRKIFAKYIKTEAGNDKANNAV